MSVFDLMVAPNGARLMPADHPAVPVTANALARTARECAKAGATAIHMHVRDRDGRHALDPDLYADAVAKVRAQCPLEIQISTEAAGIFDVAAQHRCLTHAPGPEASVALREIERDRSALPAIYRDAMASGKRLQHILYDADDLHRLLNHFEAGTIPATDRRVIFVLGRYSAGQISRPEDLSPFLNAMGANTLHWSVCAFGPNEHDCILRALDHGGHARIGFENSRQRADGSIYPDNATSIAEFVAKAAKAGFTPRIPGS